MGGIGTFDKECRTLYVGGLGNRSTLEKLLWIEFGEWGEIEVNIIFVLITAPFNSMQTQKFKTLTINIIALFAAINHNYDYIQCTLIKRNKHNGWKATNHNKKAWPCEPV